MDGMSQQPMPQGAAQPAQMGADSGKDPVKDLVSNLMMGLGMLAQVLGKSGNEQGASRVMDIIKEMQDAVMGKPESEDEAQDAPVPMKGNVDMNAGLQKVKPVM